MEIYIDESGSFLLPAEGAHKMNCVAALMIPSSSRSELFYEFLRLRDRWPANPKETKGRTLDEEQCAAVVVLLERFDVTLEVVGTDMGLYTLEELAAVQADQADGITRNLTPEHAPRLRQELEDLRGRLKHLAPQLFVEFTLLVYLLSESLQIATCFYAQRQPQEVAQFEWIVDAKDRQITPGERMWRTLLLPFLQHEGLRRPHLHLPGADYSGFQRYLVDDATVDPLLRRSLDWLGSLPTAPPGKRTGVNLRLLFDDHLHFRDSQIDLGLQLADIAASIFTRAYNGNLGSKGWEGLGALMVRKEEPSRHVKLSVSPGAGIIADHPFAKITERLQAGNKDMLTAESRQRIDGSE
jgi:Protein of unknown function (DUF3800)